MNYQNQLSNVGKDTDIMAKLRWVRLLHKCLKSYYSSSVCGVFVRQSVALRLLPRPTPHLPDGRLRGPAAGGWTATTAADSAGTRPAPLGRPPHEGRPRRVHYLQRRP